MFLYVSVLSMMFEICSTIFRIDAMNLRSISRRNPPQSFNAAPKRKRALGDLVELGFFHLMPAFKYYHFLKIETY